LGQARKNLSPQELAQRILEEAKGLSCNHRVVVIKTKQDNKKVQAALTPSEETYIFVKTLTQIRRKNKHRGVTEIGENHSHWAFIKKTIIPLVKEFAEETNNSFEKACKEFITWGMYLMNNYNITKFSTLGPKILDTYEADKEIDNDPFAEQTVEAIKFYCRWIYEKTGIQEYGSLDNPLKYVEFVRMVKFCNSKGYKVLDYLKAQFEGLDWAGGIPDPSQLNSVAAIDRFIKYVSLNKIEIKKKTTPSINWSNILNP
jgi:hypothetical protein